MSKRSFQTAAVFGTGALLGVTTSRNIEEEKGHMLHGGGGGRENVHLGYRQAVKANGIILTSC